MRYRTQLGAMRALLPARLNWEEKQAQYWLAEKRRWRAAYKLINFGRDYGVSQQRMAHLAKSKNYPWPKY